MSFQLNTFIQGFDVAHSGEDARYESEVKYPDGPNSTRVGFVR